MTKKKLLSTHFALLTDLDQLSAEAIKVLYLYTQEELSEKAVAERLNQPLYLVRKHLGMCSFLARQYSGDKDFLKALDIAKGKIAVPLPENQE